MLEQMIVTFEDEEEEIVVSKKRIPNRVAPRYARDLHRIGDNSYVEYRIETNTMSYQADNDDYDEISVPTTYTTSAKPSTPLEDGYCALLLAILGGAVRDENGIIVKGARRYSNDPSVCLDVVHGNNILSSDNSIVCLEEDVHYANYKFDNSLDYDEWLAYEETHDGDYISGEEAERRINAFYQMPQNPYKNLPLNHPLYQSACSL